MTIFFKYLIPLFLSTYLIFLSENKNLYIKSKKINKLIVIIALFIPAIVAGSRNIINVGDTKLYGDFIFNTALNNEWNYYYDYFHNNYFSFEPGYLLTSFIIAKISSNYHILFFIMSLINVILIYFGLKKLKKVFDNEIWLGMLVFYLLFFGETLNIMRQCLSLSILFFGFNYIFEKKLLKYLLIVLLAMQFHISAFIGIFLYPLYFFYRIAKKKSIYVLTVILIVLLIVVSYSYIFWFLKGLELLPSKFFSLYYLNGKAFSPFAIVTKLPMIIILIYYYLHSNNKLNNMFYIMILFIDLLISQLAGGNENLYRMSLIFSYIKMPLFSSKFELKKINLRSIIIIYCLIYFYMEYIYQGALPISLFIEENLL